VNHISTWRRPDAYSRHRPGELATPDAFRHAMAQLASGVAIVTCLHGDTPKGLLVSALTTVSIEPARMLFCVRKAASAHDALLRSDDCAIAILAEQDHLEAVRFYTSELSAERFHPSNWRLEADQPPRHRAPLVSLLGRISYRMDAGANTIFIVDVTETHAAPGRPLVYFDRGFRSLRAPDELSADLESLSGVTVWAAPAR